MQSCIKMIDLLGWSNDVGRCPLPIQKPAAAVFLYSSRMPMQREPLQLNAPMSLLCQGVFLIVLLLFWLSDGMKEIAVDEE